MNLDGLDERSASFARAVFDKWPEWRVYGIVEDAGQFRMHLPDPPGSRLSSPLSVWVDDEVTVGMDWYHCHFVWPTDRDDLAIELTDPIGFLHLLIDEQRAVMAQFAGDTWKGSCLLSREDCVAGRYRDRPSEDWLSSVDRFRVRSWRGTLDADGGY